MRGDFDFRPDMRAIAGLTDEPEMDDLLLDVGEEIADAAAARAARRTGAGAESIHAEVHRGAPPGTDFTPEDDAPTVYVSWDPQHYYMLFVEEGTEDTAPEPFLRPALEGAEF